MGLRDESERGLALLLEHGSQGVTPLLGSGPKPPGQQLADCAAHVFCFSESEIQGLASTSGDPIEGIVEVLARHVRALSEDGEEDGSCDRQPVRQQKEVTGAATAQASAKEATGTEGRVASAPGGQLVGCSTFANGTPEELAPDHGRLGPAVVGVDRASASGQLAYHGAGGLALESLASFSSCRATACVFAGRWQYEVTVQTAGIQQIGWATIHCPFTTEEGCGDANDSYAFDGKRVRKWNVKCLPYGKAWAPGDIIGSCLDLNTGELSFYRNGVSLGVAYNHIRTMQPHLAYFPALSLSFTERCELNFGARPLEHPVPGFSPIQLPPPPAKLRLYGYLSNCIERLATTAANNCCRSASAAPPVPPSAPVLAFAERLAVPPATPSNRDDRQAMAAALWLPPVTDHNNRLLGTMSDSSHGAPSFNICFEDEVLLAAALSGHLGPFLGDTFFTAYALLPAMLSAHGRCAPHNGPAVGSILRLLELTSHPSALTTALSTLLELLCRKAACAPLLSELFPYSGSYPWLALTCTIVQEGVGRRVLVQHSCLHQLLEGMLTRKSPGTDDLKTLVPHVWWPGCRDETTSETRVKLSMQALTTAISHVEDKQFELLAGILGEQLPLHSANISCRSSSGSACDGNAENDVLLTFLRYIVLKNRGANRDIQPPGLSDQTVLISVYFVILRLLRGSLHTVTTFPAGELFVRAALRNDFDMLNELPRLGGVVSHLSREVKVRDADLADLFVGNAPRPRPALPPEAGAPSAPWRSALRPPVVVELFNISMSLYALRVGVSMRMQRTMVEALAGSLVGMEEVERHMAANDNPPEYQAYLAKARNFIRDDVITNVRLSTLLKVVFFGGHKLDTLLVKACWVAHVLLAAAQQGNLLSYLPTCYFECLLDVMQALCKADPPVVLVDHPLMGGINDIFSVLVLLLHDGRIANPDVKEGLLTAIASVVESPGFLAALEKNPEAVSRLVPSLLGTFDTRLWHSVSGILQNLIKPGGFGLGPEPTSFAEPVFRRLLRVALQPGFPPFDTFLNRLLSTLNWGVTEFTVAIAEVHSNRSRRHISELQQQFRKAAVMFELAVGLMRLLEFLVRSHPAAFLAPGRAMNLQRLLEVASFVLSHFTTGPDARRLTELLSPPSVGTPGTLNLPLNLPLRLTSCPSAAAETQTRSAQRMERGMLAEKVDKAQLLAPLAGALLALWEADLSCSAQEGEHGHSFLDQLAAASDSRTIEHLNFLQKLDWQRAFPTVSMAQSSARLAELCSALQQRKNEMQVAAEARSQAGMSGRADEEEVPEELVDPITMVIMLDPVILPDSQVVVDRSTIARHLLTSATDPFSRKELRLDMLLPALDIKAKAEAWHRRHQT